MCFFRAIVPEGFVIPLKVVVCFGGVGAIVSGFPKVGDVWSEGGGDLVAAAHVLSAHGRCVSAHEDGGACDGADGGV